MVDSFATSHAPWSFAVVKHKNNNQMRETSHHHHHHYHITFYWDQSRKHCEWKIKQTVAKINLRRLDYELKLFTPQTDLCRTDLPSVKMDHGIHTAMQAMQCAHSQTAVSTNSHSFVDQHVLFVSPILQSDQFRNKFKVRPQSRLFKVSLV